MNQVKHRLAYKQNQNQQSACTCLTHAQPIQTFAGTVESIRGQVRPKTTFSRELRANRAMTGKPSQNMQSACTCLTHAQPIQTFAGTVESIRGQVRLLIMFGAKKKSFLSLSVNDLFLHELLQKNLSLRLQGHGR